MLVAKIDDNPENYEESQPNKHQGEQGKRHTQQLLPHRNYLLGPQSSFTSLSGLFLREGRVVREEARWTPPMSLLVEIPKRADLPAMSGQVERHRPLRLSAQTVSRDSRGSRCCRCTRRGDGRGSRRMIEGAATRRRLSWRVPPQPTCRLSIPAK